MKDEADKAVIWRREKFGTDEFARAQAEILGMVSLCI